MKRIFPALILLFCTVSFSSCALSLFSAPPERVREFSADTVISFGEKSFSGILCCRSAADIQLTFSSPEELNGFSVKTTPGGFVCNVFGVTDSLPGDLPPENSCARLFFEAVKCTVFEPAELFVNADGNFTASVKNGKFTALFSPDGEVLKICAPANGLNIVFGAPE